MPKIGRPVKLSTVEVQRIRKQYGTGKYSLEDMADKFKVSVPTIQHVLGRRGAYAYA